MAGANPMLPMTNSASKGKVYEDKGVKGVKPADLQIAATKGRYVFYTAAKDFNRKNVQLVAEGYLKYGFKFVTYLEDPKLGHKVASAEYLGKALDYLDAPVGEIAIARMKSVSKLARSQPALAAGQLKSVIMHSDPEKDAEDIEKAKKLLARIMDSYSAELEKLKLKMEKSSEKSRMRQLERFAGKWLQIGASDVALMRNQLEENPE